jgi:large subunit ribosomal protein L21e
MPFSRFHGLTGVVIGERGSAYEISVKDGNKTKTVIARPEHLVRNIN